jgi:hypothetical protein
MYAAPPNELCDFAIRYNPAVQCLKLKEAVQNPFGVADLTGSAEPILSHSAVQHTNAGQFDFARLGIARLIVPACSCVYPS